MSNSKENEEGDQGTPMAVDEGQQLVDAEVRAEPEEPSTEDALNHVENGKPEPPAEDHVENGHAELPAEDENVKPGKVELPAEDDGEKQVKAEPTVEDKSVNPGKVEPLVEDNSDKQVKAEPPVEDKSVNPGKAEPPVEDKSVSPGMAESLAKDDSEKAEPPTEGKSENPGKVEVPAEDNRVEPVVVLGDIPQQDVNSSIYSAPVEFDAQISNRIESEKASNAKMKADELPESNMDIENDDNNGRDNVDAAEIAMDIENDDNIGRDNVDAAEIAMEVKPEAREVADSKICDNGDCIPSSNHEPTTPQAVPAYTKDEITMQSAVTNKADEKQAVEPTVNGNSNSKQISFLNADHFYDGNESGTDEEQSAFMMELDNFFRERSMEFKPPKFYGVGLNCLKLWRSVIRLGGYDKVTSCKLWRQVGESFKPPKTCTTVSWTFRGFYEKALLDYERHKIKVGELDVPIASHPEPVNIENQASASASASTPASVSASVSGRARRDAAARAMQGWHSQRLLGNGEVSDPIIKDRNSASMQKREKQQLKSINPLKRKKPSYMDNAVKAARIKPSKPQLDTTVVDVGPPADWVKVNVQKTKDCFEVYALVPGLLREEVRVQSDPAGRLVISGEPEHPNNPWGVTPFKKVVSLPSRIDPHQTSAVVTLHGQLFVRVPFEQSE